LWLVAQKQRRHQVAPRVETRLFSLTLRLRSVKTHKMADNQRHSRYGRGNRPRCNASRGHDSRHEDRERSSRLVDFDIRLVSLQTQPLPGSAGQGTSFDPPFHFADPKTSCSSIFTEFVSSSRSLSTQYSFSSSSKPTASSPGVGFNFSSPSRKAPEKSPKQDQDSVVSKKRKTYNYNSYRTSGNWATSFQFLSSGTRNGAQQ